MRPPCLYELLVPVWVHRALPEAKSSAECTPDDKEGQPHLNHRHGDPKPEQGMFGGVAGVSSAYQQRDEQDEWHENHRNTQPNDHNRSKGAPGLVH